MRPTIWLQIPCAVVLCALTGLLAGCASNGGTTGTGPTTGTQSGTSRSSSSRSDTSQLPARYKAVDGRTIDIGRSSSTNGGLNFKNPHLNKCWIADGFNFNGYNTLYIAPTLSTAKLNNREETQPHELAKEDLPIELERSLRKREIFPNVVVKESQIQSSDRVLKMENTIVEYAKGGGAARFWAGLYGAGQPVLRVQGKMTDGDRTVFVYEARRSGTSAGARMAGAYLKDTDIQREDIASMCLDLADFMSAISGKLPAK